MNGTASYYELFTNTLVSKSIRSTANTLTQKDMPHPLVQFRHLTMTATFLSLQPSNHNDKEVCIPRDLQFPAVLDPPRRHGDQASAVRHVGRFDIVIHEES